MSRCQIHTTAPAVLSLLNRLGLSESEVQLYLILNEYGALTARELIKHTGLKRPTIYYALRQLMEKGLAHKSGVPGVERFQAEPPEKLLTVAALQRQHIEALEEELKKIIPLLSVAKLPREGMPKISFYEGEKAMQRSIMDTLYCRSGKIDYLTPHENFFWQTDRSFAEAYINERVARGIHTRHLWEKLLAPELMERSYKGLAEVRILPPAMHKKFRTTLLVYDDTVMYIASRASGYALLVQSKEHAELMSAIFTALWGGAKPTKF